MKSREMTSREMASREMTSREMASREVNPFMVVNEFSSKFVLTGGHPMLMM